MFEIFAFRIITKNSRDTTTALFGTNDILQRNWVGCKSDFDAERS